MEKTKLVAMIDGLIEVIEINLLSITNKAFEEQICTTLSLLKANRTSLEKETTVDKEKVVLDTILTHLFNDVDHVCESTSNLLQENFSHDLSHYSIH